MFCIWTFAVSLPLVQLVHSFRRSCFINMNVFLLLHLEFCFSYRNSFHFDQFCIMDFWYFAFTSLVYLHFYYSLYRWIFGIENIRFGCAKFIPNPVLFFLFAFFLFFFSSYFCSFYFATELLLFLLMFTFVTERQQWEWTFGTLKFISFGNYTTRHWRSCIIES